jgi:hypothetical protein
MAKENENGSYILYTGNNVQVQEELRRWEQQIQVPVYFDTHQVPSDHKQRQPGSDRNGR